MPEVVRRMSYCLLSGTTWGAFVQRRRLDYVPYARAAKRAEAVAIRTNRGEDVKAIKKETGLPVIGFIKKPYVGFEQYITVTMKEVNALVGGGS